MKNILREGIWDNVITSIKRAKNKTGSVLGSASSTGQLALLKTTEMLHRGFEVWCGANNRNIKDSNALYDYLVDDVVVGYSDKFATKWADNYDEFLRDPKDFLLRNNKLATPVGNSNSPAPSNSATAGGANTPINNNNRGNNQPASSATNQPIPAAIQTQIDHTEAIFGPVFAKHFSSKLYKQYATGKSPANFPKQPDGLFIFITNANLKKMKSIRALIKSGSMAPTEKYTEYVKQGIMLSWIDIAKIIKVAPTEQNAKLAIANSMKKGIPRNWFKDVKRFAMSHIADTQMHFIITESSKTNDANKILMNEALSTKLRQFFRLLTADGNMSGATRHAVDKSRGRGQQSQSSGGSSSLSQPARNPTGNSSTPASSNNSASAQTAGAAYASATPICTFTRPEIDYIKSAENNFNGGLVGLATVNQTTNIQHKKEISAVIKKIVAAGLANLKKNHPNILS